MTKASWFRYFRFELLHQTSFGHPFYQHELAHFDQLDSNLKTIFVTSRHYPYTEVLSFVQSRFLLIELPDFLIRFLIALHILKQNILINPCYDYSVCLEQSTPWRRLDCQFSLLQRSKPIKLLLISRSKEQMLSSQYLPSVRDSCSDTNQQIAETLSDKSMSFRYLKSYSTNKLRGNGCVDKVHNNTLNQLRWSDVVIGTNTGPYVAAESIGKPVFFIMYHQSLGQMDIISATIAFFL